MHTSTTHLNYYRAFAIACLIVLLGVSCTFSLPVSIAKPAIETVHEFQFVTKIVTQQVTQEVTRVVEVPLTITPLETPLYTFISSPNPINTNSPTLPEPPVVTILGHSDCLYGPGSFYLYKYSVFANDIMEVIGRDMDGSWVYIQVVHGWNPCWIQTSAVKFNTGDINSVPIVYSSLPYSNQYQSPDAVAQRDGIEVTISWKAVWMSLDDYRGYLIEARLCQGGAQIFIPTSYFPSLSNNTGTLSIKLTDEPGCVLPSSARIYSAEKHGYSDGYNIPWPAYTLTPTPDR